MAKIEDLDAVILHFDTEDHAIPLDQFVNASNSAKLILENINSVVFGSNIKYQLYVGVPKEGGLIDSIYVDILAVAVPVYAVISSEIGKGYIKGFTGKDPAEWAEFLGKNHKDVFAKFANKFKQKADSDVEEPLLLVDRVEKEIISKIVVEMTVSFVRSDSDRLEKIGVINDNFSQALIARNRIFEDLIENPAIKGLGFDDSHEFTYQRKDFARNVIAIPDRIASATPVAALPIWHEEQTDIVAYSPNWERNGRRWQGSNSKFKAITFEIEDEAFWKHVEVKDIKPAIKDNMKVQLAYTIENGKPKNIRVLKVLSFNGKKISNPLKGDGLSKALNEYVSVEPSSGDLFSWEEIQEQKSIDRRTEKP